MWMTIFMPLLILTAAIDPRAAAEPAVCSLSAQERGEFTAAINRLRSEWRLDDVRGEVRLNQAAAAHALDMAWHQKMSHQGSSGSTLLIRLRRSGYEPAIGAENVAWNQPDVDEVISDWMDSPAHRRALLEPDVVHFGIARHCSTAGEPYWTLLLGTPRGTRTQYAGLAG